MRKILRDVLMPTAVFFLLAFVGFFIVQSLSGLAFSNTGVALEEQSIEKSAREMIREVETALSFGKSVENYYGMDEILGRLCALEPDNMEAAVLSREREILYTSFAKDPGALDMAAEILAGTFQGKRSMEFPVMNGAGETLGFVLLVYAPSKFRGAENPPLIQWVILAVLTLAVAFFYLLSARRWIRIDGKWKNRLPAFAVMAGVLAQITVLYVHYQASYSQMIRQHAEATSELIGRKAEDLIEKGLPSKELGRIAGYFAQAAKDSDVVWNVRFVSPVVDTSEILRREEEDGYTVARNLGEDGKLQMLVTENVQFLRDSMKDLAATFLAVFVICFMMVLELVQLIELLKQKMDSISGPGQAGCKRQSIPHSVRLFSFLTYTAIYASMPYSAVIMRGWNASVFGFNSVLSSSIPMTLELLGALIFSALIPKFVRKSKAGAAAAVSLAVLIAGNLGSAAAVSPYALIAARGVCSFGFAMFKYFINCSAASGGEDEMPGNFAMMNAGMLGGITAGGSIGAVVAKAAGYQSDFIFTAGVLAVTSVVLLLVFPWKRLQSMEDRGRESAGPGLMRALKSPGIIKILVLGNIPLNVGLLYIVAFLPVYMDQAGQSALSVSYAFLINGICGAYLGVALVRLMKNLPKYLSVSLSMLLAAFGILILTVWNQAGAVMVSAGLMGLFDGFGTPNITSCYLSRPELGEIDPVRATMAFHVLGGGVQVICPALYGFLARPDGGMLGLTVFGGVYAAASLAFFLFFLRRKGGQIKTVKTR